jgi:hypothetical protein
MNLEAQDKPRLPTNLPTSAEFSVHQDLHSTN